MLLKFSYETSVIIIAALARGGGRLDYEGFR